MDSKPMSHEDREKAAFEGLTPTPVDDGVLPPEERFALVRRMLAERKLPKSPAASRMPAFFYPGLSSRPIHPTEDFPWAAAVLSQVEAFREELAAVTRDRAFHTVWADFTAAGEWAAVWLRLYGQLYEENASRCPRTLAAVENVPGQGGWLGFSAMAPHTHIAPHCGVTNAKLRCHVPLELVPGESRIRIDNEVYRWTPGEMLIFDDSYEHEVWNDSDERRIILIFDIFHPDLTAEEIAWLTEVESLTVRQQYNSRMEWERAASSQLGWMQDN